MTATTSQTLEERVEQLEETVSKLVAAAATAQSPARDWRSLVGYVNEEDEELSRQADEAGRLWREEENRKSLL
jgi:hypothetical protein